MVAIDRLLLQRWSCEGDPQAFSELVRRHGNMVYAACFRILQNREQAEETARCCFMKLAASESGFSCAIPSWLHTLATRESLIRVKSEGLGGESALPSADQASAAQAVDTHRLEAVLDESIAEIPEKLREVLVVHFLEQRSHETIAIDLGIPPRIVSRRIAKGVERMRAQLEKRGIHTEPAALPGLFHAGLSETAPPSLHSSLERLALTGALPRRIDTGSRGKVVSASLLKSAIALLILALACLLAYIAVRDRRVTLRDFLRPQNETHLLPPPEQRIPEELPADGVGPASAFGAAQSQHGSGGIDGRE